jgi:hypothetical protein
MVVASWQGRLPCGVIALYTPAKHFTPPGNRRYKVARPDEEIGE